MKKTNVNAKKLLVVALLASLVMGCGSGVDVKYVALKKDRAEKKEPVLDTMIVLRAFTAISYSRGEERSVQYLDLLDSDGVIHSISRDYPVDRGFALALPNDTVLVDRTRRGNIKNAVRNLTVERQAKRLARQR